jgi:DNA-binding Lrp family transcriptional regulator
MKIKQKDYKLFSALRENARFSLMELSRQTGIPVSTVYERLRQHKNTVISKYTVLLNFRNLGYGVRLFFIIKAKKNKKEKLKQHLLALSCVNTLHRVNHGNDFLGEALFKDISQGEAFLEELEENYETKRQETYYILETLKQERFMDSEKEH